MLWTGQILWIYSLQTGLQLWMLVYSFWVFFLLSYFWKNSTFEPSDNPNHSRQKILLQTSLDITTGKCSIFSNSFLFLFSNKMLVFRAGIHKMLVRIANREDPDQTASASSEAVWSRSTLFVYSFFGRQLVFKILEHLPHLQKSQALFAAYSSNVSCYKF